MSETQFNEDNLRNFAPSTDGAVTSECIQQLINAVQDGTESEAVVAGDVLRDIAFDSPDMLTEHISAVINEVERGNPASGDLIRVIEHASTNAATEVLDAHADALYSIVTSGISTEYVPCLLKPLSSTTSLSSAETEKVIDVACECIQEGFRYSPNEEVCFMYLKHAAVTDAKSIIRCKEPMYELVTCGDPYTAARATTVLCTTAAQNTTGFDFDFDWLNSVVQRQLHSDNEVVCREALESASLIANVQSKK